MELVVIAKQHQELGVGEFDQAVGVRRPADLAFQGEVDEPRIVKGGDDLGGIIVRSVVGHHQGEIPIGLPKDALDGPAQELRPFRVGIPTVTLDRFSVRCGPALATALGHVRRHRAAQRARHRDPPLGAAKPPAKRVDRPRTKPTSIAVLPAAHHTLQDQAVTGDLDHLTSSPR